ncbi:MAG: ATP-binding protein [Planctomycetia bacterium]|nr:ATP-binding protein [Planctomycetia bacterium]
MTDYEQLGVFYLGRQYDLAARKATPAPLLYDSKDLVTHAVCVGMTGSGKTGLCLALLEEAAIDGIPAICIDPKGDLGNLLLTFPEQRTEDFQPWIDPAEAAQQGKSVEQYAAETATRWREGLASWDQQPDRIARLRAAAELAIYTPANRAGRPLTVLRSFAPPSAAEMNDAAALRDRIMSTVSGLLALLGVEADPLQSREHILLATMFDQAWRAGREITLEGLVREIPQPAFDRVGVIDLESFFPAKERFAFAMRLNNLLASPGFAAWLEGEPLDVGKLLYTPSGKPRVSVLSIAHLGDAERMFFVTLLLNAVLSWVRKQPGTSSLRAILYMDEVFGFFPPTANPPSKLPMLTLLKQARAFGLGVVLATQNPVDLDYKGLANAGTWFLGRLQTERDKLRVLEGLEGAAATTGSTFDRAKIEATLAGLGQRVFLMNNVHDDRPTVFQTRWTLSYLRGPMTLEQIAKVSQQTAAPAETPQVAAAAPAAAVAASATAARPILPPDVEECFVVAASAAPQGAKLVYRPAVYGEARLHYKHAKASLDQWEALHALYGLVESPGEALFEAPPWNYVGEFKVNGEPSPGASFEPLPPAFAQAKCYARLETTWKGYLYRAHRLELWECLDLKQTSTPGEAESAFRQRLGLKSREVRDERMDALRAKYAPKLAAIQEKMSRAQQKLEREQSEANAGTFDAAVSFGASIVGAILGRKKVSRTNVGRAASSARAASRAAKQQGDVGRAATELNELRDQLLELDAKYQGELDAARTAVLLEALTIVPLLIQPRKSEITVSRLVLAWTPWYADNAGNQTPAYQ